MAELGEDTPKFTPFFDSVREDGYFSGWLIPEEFVGMNEVWTILVTRDEANDRKQLRYRAIVLTKNADGSSNDEDNFISSSIQAKGDRLSFTTTKIRGIQYKFDGRFLYGGSALVEGQPIARGTMRKIVNGKTVAKFTADLSYHEPVCFH